MLIVMLLTVILISIIGYYRHVPSSKVGLIIIISLISIFAVYNPIHPVGLLILYGSLAILPLILILLKKHLFNGFLFWFILVLFNYFGTIPFPNLPDIKLERFVWLSIMGIYFVEMLSKTKKNVLSITKIEIAMFILCVLILVSMINVGTIYQEGRGIVLSIFLSGFAIPFSIFYLAKNLADDEEKIKKIFMFFTMIGFYLGITGIFEHFKIDALVFPHYIMNSNAGIHWGRSRGPFLNAGTNGMVMSIIFYMGFYMLLQKYKTWIRFFLAATLVFILISILFTFTRSAWLAFLLSLPVIPVFFPKTRVAFTFAMLALILFIPIYQQFQLEDESYEIKTEMSAKELLQSEAGLKDKITGRAANLGPIYIRINLYGAVWRMFLEKPLFGFGFNKFQEVSPLYFYRIEGIPYYEHGRGLQTHDTLAGILVELGLVGLILIFIIVLLILRDSLKLYISLPSEGFISKGFIAVFWGICIIYLTTSQFMDTRYFIFSNCLFFMTAGIIVGLKQRSQIIGSQIENSG